MSKFNFNEKQARPHFVLIAIVSVIIGAFVLLYYSDIVYAAISTIGAVMILNLFFYFSNFLKKSAESRKMEEVFPDFIELMGSNLRAGMTIDKALLLSSRKEFSPLDKEIMKLGKDIITGKEITVALNDMSNRIESEKIKKTLELLVSGIRSGGNIAILLEETATGLRERGFVEKKAASNVLMYEIFIFFAIAVGAPALFALSTVLVQVLHDIISTMPGADSESMKNLPISLTKLSITPEFVTYYALVFVAIIDFLASLILGVVNKGDEKEGMKYFIPLVIVSFVLFIAIKLTLSGFFSAMLVS